MELWIAIIIIIIALAAGLGAGYGIHYYMAKQEKARQQAKAEDILAQAQEQAHALELQAKDKAIQIRQAAEVEVGRRRSDLSREEDRLQKRREEMDGRADRLEKREATLNKRQSLIDKRANDIEKLHSDQVEELQRISQMTTEDARGVLLAEVEKDARGDMARIIRQVEGEAQEEGERRAREIISTAIQRLASEHVSEVTTSVVPIPSEEMKGRIIGRNGRNIHAFEQAAGVDVIVDDTPEAVTISCFDPVRREVARRSLAKLVQDGRIHPAHVEKILKQEQREVDRIIADAGEQAAYDAGVPGLHPEVMKMLGRLKFRTSYGQNQLNHSVEAAHIAAMLAAELGANIETAKMGALLHDLGKAMDHDQEGTHAQIGAEFAKRFKVPPIVVNAIASHHHEVEQETIEAIIVEAADAISGARPGARRESLENYIKRVRTLEEIATSFAGVESAYALQAGREIRILVKPNQIDDLAAVRLSKEISKNIEDSMQYPGQIQVTVIRETRAVGFAK